jgi:hypothetical protein
VRKAPARKKEITEDRLNGLFSFYRQFSQFCKVKKKKPHFDEIQKATKSKRNETRLAPDSCS